MWRAIVEQETTKKMVIQHLLVMGDSSVIKYWRRFTGFIIAKPTLKVVLVTIIV